MELNQLKYFYYVVKNGGFTRASRDLHVEQPSISRAVKAIEDELGVRLLERTKRSVRMTRVGEEVFALCSEIFQKTEIIQRLADSERTECRGVLRLGAANAVSGFLIPRALEKFHRKYPDVWPMTYSGPAEVSLLRVEKGEYEFALLFHSPKLPTSLVETTVASVRHQVVIAAKYQRAPDVRRSFIGSREVDDPSNRHFPTLDRLRKRDNQTRIRISTNDMAAHKSLVLSGLGVAVLPEFMIQDELESGRLVPMFKERPPEFPLRLVTRKGQALGRVAQLFLEEIRTCLEISS